MSLEGKTNFPRLLYYPIPYKICDANAVKALELVPYEEGEWVAVERDDLLDVFKIWHLIGEYK